MSQNPERVRPRVLVADDDAAFRLLYRIWLSVSGYDVLAATDGADALDLVAEHGLPDVAVLDVNMPRVDGLALCRALRHRSSRLPIVIVSGEDEIEPFALAAGADVVLVKTAEREELCAALAAASESRWASESSPVFRAAS